MLSGELLVAAAGALAGAARLQRQISAAARQAGPQAPGSVLWPLLSGLKVRFLGRGACGTAMCLSAIVKASCTGC